MATKAQLLKILKETCPLPRVPVHRAPAKPSGLYLLQLRSHVIETNSPKVKLHVSVDPDNSQDSQPKPVKIVHN